jgi:hypothetical protein
MQSAGLANGSRSILKLPAASLVAIATPSTVIVRFGIAVPSILSLVPLTSAREMLTSASAADAASAAAITTSKPIEAKRHRLPTSRAVHERRVVLCLSLL